MLFIVSSFDKEAAIAFRTKAEAIKLSLEQAPEALNKQCNIKPALQGRGFSCLESWVVALFLPIQG
jgi:hypothetical protein